MGARAILRRFSIIIAAALVVMLGFGVSSASASPGNYQFYPGTSVLVEGMSFAGGTWYGVNFNDACRLKYPGVYSQAVSNDTSDAASLLCVTPTGISHEQTDSTSYGSDFTVSVSYGNTSTGTYRVLGGLDLQRWCQLKHSGSSAISWLDNVGSWVCIK